MPSMQLAVEDPGSSGNNCGEGYSCAYTNTISWQTPTKPLPMELNPQVIFERMFGDGSTAEERARRRGCCRLAAWVETGDGELRAALIARGYRAGELLTTDLAMDRPGAA